MRFVGLWFEFHLQAVACWTTVQNPSLNQPRRRPLLMSTGLLLTWFVGFRGLQEGWTSVELIKQPLSVDSLEWPDAVKAAFQEGMQAHAQTALPLGIAQGLLGLVLVIVAGGSLLSGRLPLRFFLQLLGVSGALAVLSYWLEAPIRAQVVDALAQTPGLIDSGELDATMRDSVIRWGFHLGLLLHLGTLVFAMIAVTRPSARQFLAAAAEPRQE